jgi:SAM-dependent methyltransferase
MSDPVTTAKGHEYDDYDLEVGGGLPRYHDWMMASFLPHLHGRVLEVGAGIGTISERYVDAAREVVLVEPAPTLHAKLARKFADKPHVHTAHAFLEGVVGRDLGGLRVEEGTFDTAIMVDVLEHIEDDEATLRTLFRLLKPGGKLLIFVPALPVLYGAVDAHIGHFRRYTRGSLERVIRAADFRIETLRYFDLLGTVPWFVNGRILKRKAVSDGGLRLYDRVIIPICEVVDRITGPKIGKNLVCIAEKSV